MPHNPYGGTMTQPCYTSAYSVARLQSVSPIPSELLSTDVCNKLQALGQSTPLNFLLMNNPLDSLGHQSLAF